eukprot:968262_1
MNGPISLLMVLFITITQTVIVNSTKDRHPHISRQLRAMQRYHHLAEEKNRDLFGLIESFDPLIYQLYMEWFKTSNVSVSYVANNFRFLPSSNDSDGYIRHYFSTHDDAVVAGGSVDAYNYLAIKVSLRCITYFNKTMAPIPFVLRFNFLRSDGRQLPRMSFIKLAPDYGPRGFTFKIQSTVSITPFIRGESVWHRLGGVKGTFTRYDLPPTPHSTYVVIGLGLKSLEFIHFLLEYI